MRTTAILLFALLSSACGDAREKAEEAKKKVEALKSQATVKAFDAARVAFQVKSELAKIYKATSDYDLDVSSEDADDEGMKAHQQKIAAMPHVTIGDLTVGYEEDQNRSLRGTAYSRHFRATFGHGRKKVAISYFTKEELDVQAFAKLLEQLVPLVRTQLGG